jgi:CRISPR/Cas system-associated exonuclease Cas4 (RecB family)
MDLITKRFFDRYRKSGKLPPELQGKVRGQLFPDQELINQWRSWKSAPFYKDETRWATLIGAVDDCLEDGDKLVIIDTKTRGTPPKVQECRALYGLQLDCYAILLETTGRLVASTGYLIYYYPVSVRAHGEVKFAVQPVEIDVRPEEGRHVFEAAADCLNGEEPPASKNCKFCRWAQRLNERKK